LRTQQSVPKLVLFGGKRVGDTMRVSVAVLRSYVEVLGARGVSAADFLGRIGFPFEALHDPRRFLSQDEIARASRVAVEMSGDPGFGLHLASTAELTQALNVVGPLLMNGATLREAAAAFDQFRRLLVDDIRATLTEHGDVAHYGISDLSIDAWDQRFLTEIVLALSVRVGRSYVWGRRPIIEVRFAYPRPDYVDSYYRFFDAPLFFDAPRSELVFPRTYLETPHLHADPTLFQVLSDRAKVMLEAARAPDSIVPRVRDFLRSADLATVTAVDVARALGSSRRTVSRQLGAQGVTLQSLMDDVRREIALNLMRDPSFPLKLVSARLGYSEASTFHRRFRHWTGTTPLRFRSDHKAEPARRPSNER
jgi:AraC-like DNA-binding protein